ncbi:MAG: EVE domain-containing protein [Proteobacteria bacterium]|nr:EVE domain-containing protein [Pseudomonadota bacterium]
MRNWLAVASADHVRLGRRLGFVQISHGRAAPLRRVQPGDRIVCYSPTDSFRGNDRLQAFTAIGTVRAGAIYQAETPGGFRPHRRAVDWHDATEIPVAVVQNGLEFSRGKNWGYRLRSGLAEISDRDMAMIAEAMFTAAAPPHRQAA